MARLMINTEAVSECHHTIVLIINGTRGRAVIDPWLVNTGSLVTSDAFKITLRNIHQQVIGNLRKSMIASHPVGIAFPGGREHR